MKGKSLAILAGAVVILGAFIWFFERHQMTTEEAEGASGSGFRLTRGRDGRQFRDHQRPWPLQFPAPCFRLATDRPSRDGCRSGCG